MSHDNSTNSFSLGDGWHAMEGMQCMLERRKGGETGVAEVRYLEGDAVRIRN